MAKISEEYRSDAVMMRILNRFVLVILSVVSVSLDLLGDEPPLARFQSMSPEAQKVMMFLRENQGRVVLSGQEEAPQQLRKSQNMVISITGKRPAVRGWDIRMDNPCPVDEAIESWTQYRQLITFSWHMGLLPLPDSYVNSKEDASLEYIQRILTPGDELNDEWRKRLDHIALKLQKLQQHNIPVLWRPFHEADGDAGTSWFWWSDGGYEGLQLLWQDMFDYYTNDKKMDHLIWVFSYNKDPEECINGTGRDWYPGGERCDVVGVDYYTSLDDETNQDKWSRSYQNLRRIAPESLIALTENDIIPHPNKMIGNHEWSWFLTWHNEWLLENGVKRLKEIYHHEKVITADEMPYFSEMQKNDISTDPE